MNITHVYIHVYMYIHTYAYGASCGPPAVQREWLDPAWLCSLGQMMGKYPEVPEATACPRLGT